MEPDLTVTGTTEECEELIPSHLCDDYDGATVERAFIRLMSGDVTKTRYGWRVSLRHDLDDHRGEAKAYWPEQNACCLCWSRKSRGYCSHELAVKLAKELLQRRMTERTQMAEAKLDGLHGRGCDEPYR
jgi:hypothetical protein